MGRGVLLREFRLDDVAMAVELSTDPYVPLTGSLPANAGPGQAREWVERQQGRLAEGTGWSFAIADCSSDQALGAAGLWFTDSLGVFTVGYGVVPSERGRGVATEALGLLVEFAWGLPMARRLVAHVEPWNTASLRAAERVGFRAEGSTRHEIGDELRVVVLMALERDPAHRSPQDPRVLDP